MMRLLHWLWGFVHQHRPAAVGAALLALVVVTAVIGPWVCPYQPDQSFGGAAAPSAAHWLGADSQGYDIATRMIHGARTTLRVAITATLLSMTLGGLVGCVSGYCRGAVDLLLMRAVDFAMSFPGFLLAMVTAAVLGKSLNNLVYAVGLVGAPIFARQVRAEVLRIASMDYVLAARAVGAAPWRIMLRHILPNSMGPIIVLATLGMGGAILDVAGLSFLGLGGDPFVAEWGAILFQGWKEIDRGALQVGAAGLAIFITVLGFNLVGDGLRDQLDPRAKRRV